MTLASGRRRNVSTMRMGRIGSSGFRWFAGPVEEPRARRASDVLLVVGATVGLVVAGWVSAPPSAVEQAAIDLLAALPTLLEAVWQLLYDGLALWALALVIIALARRRVALARDQLLGTLVALLVGILTAWVVADEWPGLGSALSASGPPPDFPCLRVALAGACVATASPHLSRPVRRLSQWVVALGAAAAALLGATTPTGAIAGVLVAALAAAVVHLVFGSCGGRPGLGDVQAAVADLGCPWHRSARRIASRPARSSPTASPRTDGRSR